MINSQQFWLKPVKTLCAIIACTVVFGVSSQTVSAQTGDKIRGEYPQVADLLNAFDVTQAKAFEAIARINSEPAYELARANLQEYLAMQKKMTKSDFVNSDGAHRAMNSTASPYFDSEVEARINLLNAMRTMRSNEEAYAAYVDNTAISSHAAEILRRGRDFENQLFEIFLDDSIANKQSAVSVAIVAYQSDETRSVTSSTKESSFLIEHDQATGFATAFPRLSGLLWTQQWFQLASLEAIILRTMDTQFADGMDTALERFWNKVGTDGGMSMFPAPSELPMAPAIAPDLYSLSPEAAVILDNLNILETVLADILSYPNVEDRATRMDAAVARFTNKGANGSHNAEYLLFALRGGIYNQGGPAVGQMMYSERNRSRAAMDMVQAATYGSDR
tara:strand:+ start:55 stop:1227 length:1173 start_codon:yes stop_codon:yes gene_type:complete